MSIMQIVIEKRCKCHERQNAYLMFFRYPMAPGRLPWTYYMLTMLMFRQLYGMKHSVIPVPLYNPQPPLERYSLPQLLECSGLMAHS